MMMSTPVFQLHNFSTPEYCRLSAVISGLSGRILPCCTPEDPVTDPGATHAVVNDRTASKMRLNVLTAIASGIWVLKEE